MLEKKNAPSIPPAFSAVTRHVLATLRPISVSLLWLPTRVSRLATLPPMPLARLCWRSTVTVLVRAA